jgi:hypothetical protein
MHPVIAKARDLLAGREQWEAEEKVWREQHADQPAAPEVDVLLTKSAASTTVKTRDFNDGLIHKTRDDALVQQPQASAMSPELQQQWNDWADDRIRHHIDLLVTALGSECGELYARPIAKLEKEVLALDEKLWRRVGDDVA